MTNLHAWRVAGGWSARPKPGLQSPERTLASRIIREAPAEDETSEPESTPSFAALGVAIVVGGSGVLWAAIIAGGYLLLR